MYCFCAAGKIFPEAFCRLAVLEARGICTVVVTVYARHSGKCPQIKVNNAGQHRRCKCPLWLRWGKSHKRSAKSLSFPCRNYLFLGFSNRTLEVAPTRSPES